MDNDDLAALWERQVREQVEREHPDLHERWVRGVAGRGTDAPLPTAAVAEQVREFLNKRTQEWLPFALKVGRESGATGLLTGDQLAQAGILSAQQRSHDMLAQFEGRLENAPATMSPLKRYFAQALLAMSKRHTDLIDARFTSPEGITESDLEEVTSTIAADLDQLTATLPRSWQSDDNEAAPQ